MRKQAIERDIIEFPKAPAGGVLERLGHRFGAVSGMDPVVAERVIEMAMKGEVPQFASKGELAGLMSILANAFIEEANRATTDKLTTISNRDGATEFFNQEKSRMERGQSSGGVILFFDLDKFKPINDTYGHEVGDQCLKAVGSALRLKSRASDVPVRLGGDEFVLILSNTTLEKSQSHIEHLFNHINSISIPTSQGFAQVRTSVGVTEYTVNDTFEDALKRADDALYINKRERKAAEAARAINAGQAANNNLDMR